MIPESMRASVDMIVNRCVTFGFTVQNVDISAGRYEELPEGVTSEQVEKEGTAYDYADHLHVIVLMQLDEKLHVRDNIANKDRLSLLGHGLDKQCKMNDGLLLDPSNGKYSYGRAISASVKDTPVECCATLIQIVPGHPNASLS
jgi:hypothetical protein